MLSSSLKLNSTLTWVSLPSLTLFSLLSLGSLFTVHAQDLSSDGTSTITDPASGDGLSGDSGMSASFPTDSGIVPTDMNVDVSTSTDPTATGSMAQQSSSASFKDVPSSHAYAAAIQWAANAKVVQGYADGSFKPNTIVNRAEFLKILLGAKNVDLSSDVSTPIGFNDVDANAWYAPYVRYAKAHGIIQGYADGSFKPNQSVNFAEALKIAYTTLGISTKPTNGVWYEQYLQHAKTNGVLYSNSADVSGGMQRKDVVWLTWKLMTHQGTWLGQ